MKIAESQHVIRAWLDEHNAKDVSGSCHGDPAPAWFILCGFSPSPRPPVDQARFPTAVVAPPDRNCLELDMRLRMSKPHAEMMARRAPSARNAYYKIREHVHLAGFGYADEQDDHGRLIGFRVSDTTYGDALTQDHFMRTLRRMYGTLAFVGEQLQQASTGAKA